VTDCEGVTIADTFDLTERPQVTAETHNDNKPNNDDCINGTNKDLDLSRLHVVDRGDSLRDDEDIFATLIPHASDVRDNLDRAHLPRQVICNIQGASIIQSIGCGCNTIYK
jgi:hypothetical protein